MKFKVWLRIVSIILIVASLFCYFPAVLATDNTKSIIEAGIEIEGVQETDQIENPLPKSTGVLTEEQPEPEVEPSESEDTVTESDVPLSMDGYPLVRTFVNPRMRSATGTMTKSLCTYVYSYVSPYWYCNQYYTGTAHLGGHYFYCETIAYHEIDGEVAYCLEPNASSANAQQYTGYSDGFAPEDSYWMVELDATQRELIKTVLTFSYPEVDYGYGEQAQYAATQVILWEIIMRHRYPDLNSTSHAGLYNSVKAILGTKFTDAYNAVLNGISVYDGKCPSFASDDASNIPTVKLTLNKSTNCYEGTVTDSNAVLERYTFAKDGVTFTRNGNGLTISVPASSASAVKGKVVTGTSTMKDMDTSNPQIWENSTYQTVCTAGGAKPAEAYFKLDWEDNGGIKVIKKVSDASVSLQGWIFYFKNNSTGETITKTTDSNGNICVTGLQAGTKYTVSEKTYDGYNQVPSQTVTIEAGKTTELTFTNKPLTGNLTVTKSVNYGTLKGFQFRLYGTSTIGKKVDTTITTDANGTAKFTGIYVGSYTLEEDSPGNQYIVPSSQTVTITANATTGVGSTVTATMTNTWKHWRATVTKADAETTSAQGNSSLEGAEYTLYKNGTAVKTYTVKNGSFTTDYYPCTESNSVYTLKETKAPAGYALDSTVYKLTTSYGDYSKAENTFSLTAKDTVIKGKIQVEKYAYNTVSGSKTPEKGATYQVWLKSAGSYAKAKDSEKDTITIGDNGKGISKSLPYGTYCLKQVSGWDGYIKDENTYEVSITSNGTTVVKDTSGKSLVFYNKIWTGSLTILKVDGDTKTVLSGAEFTLTGSDGSKVTADTGTDGKVTFSDLVYGVTYTWEETSAPKGYLVNEENTGTVSVDKDNATIEVTCENFRREGEIIVTKTNSGGDPLPGCAYLLEYKNGGTWTPVSKRVDASVTTGGCTSPNLKNGCVTTDETGVASFTGLMADGSIQYRLTEVSAPEGYSLLTEPVYEGILPVAVDKNLASSGAEEIIGNTAYFYRLPVTVTDGHIYTLPQTGGSGNSLFMMGLLAMFTAGVVFLRHYKKSKKNNKENA